MRGERLNVLVLGVGGNVSQGIMKALAVCPVPCRIVAACISSRSMGLYLADKAYISPLADDPDFFGWLVGICKRERVHAVLSGTEQVLKVLSQRKDELREETGSICVVSDAARYAIGDDKLATYAWLRSFLSRPRRIPKGWQLWCPRAGFPSSPSHGSAVDQTESWS